MNFFARYIWYTIFTIRLGKKLVFLDPTQWQWLKDAIAYKTNPRKMPLCFCTLKKSRFRRRKKKKLPCTIPKWPTKVPSHLDAIQKSPFVVLVGCYSFSLLNCVITNIWMHKRRNVVGRSAENCLATIFSQCSSSSLMDCSLTDKVMSW